MKVTVCFGEVRVVVPCGEGRGKVKGLVEEAVARYKKALYKSESGADGSWLTPSSVKLLLADGGILDWDDTVGEVIDDKEQITAVHDDGGAAGAVEVGGVSGGVLGRHHHTGDGTSGSSGGTSSPDIYPEGARYGAGQRDGRGGAKGAGFGGARGGVGEFGDDDDDDANDVIVTSNDLLQGSRLVVRRVSEPSISQTSDNDDSSTAAPSDTGQITEDLSVVSSRRDPVGGVAAFRTPVSLSARPPASLPDHLPATAPPGLIPGAAVTRPGLRTNAAHRPDLKVKLFADQSGEATQPGLKDSSQLDMANATSASGRVESRVVFSRATEPLGIHVVPVFDDASRSLGLSIETVEVGGRAHRDGRLARHDTIVEINGNDLFNVEFSKAQDIFRSALLAPELCMRVVRGGALPLPLPSPLTPSTNPSGPGARLVTRVADGEEAGGQGGKIGPAVPVRNPRTTLSQSGSVDLSPTNQEARLSTNGSGRFNATRIDIRLIKGQYGLGFSITTRDSVSLGASVIYVKKVLPLGAAAEDGRLKPGDILVELNGEAVASKTQTDIIDLLRSTPYGATVCLAVSRQKVSGVRPLSTIGLPSTVANQSQSAVTPGGMALSRSVEQIHHFMDSNQRSSSKSSDEEEEGEGSDVVFHTRAAPGLRHNAATGASMEDLRQSGMTPVAAPRFSTTAALLKSASMENLGTTEWQRRREGGDKGQEGGETDSVGSSGGAGGIARGRDFNQSFRTAVDKSYESPAAGAAANGAEGSGSDRLLALSMQDVRGDQAKQGKQDKGGSSSSRGLGWLFGFRKTGKSDEGKESKKASKKEKKKKDGKNKESPAKSAKLVDDRELLRDSKDGATSAAAVSPPGISMEFSKPEVDAYDNLVDSLHVVRTPGHIDTSHAVVLKTTVQSPAVQSPALQSPVVQSPAVQSTAVQTNPAPDQSPVVRAKPVRSAFDRDITEQRGPTLAAAAAITTQEGSPAGYHMHRSQPDLTTGVGGVRGGDGGQRGEEGFARSHPQLHRLDLVSNQEEDRNFEARDSPRRPAQDLSMGSTPGISGRIQESPQPPLGPSQKTSSITGPSMLAPDQLDGYRDRPAVIPHGEYDEADYGKHWSPPGKTHPIASLRDDRSSIGQPLRVEYYDEPARGLRPRVSFDDDKSIGVGYDSRSPRGQPIVAGHFAEPVRSQPIGNLHDADSSRFRPVANKLLNPHPGYPDKNDNYGRSEYRQPIEEDLEQYKGQHRPIASGERYDSPANDQRYGLRMVADSPHSFAQYREPFRDEQYRDPIRAQAQFREPIKNQQYREPIGNQLQSYTVSSADRYDRDVAYRVGEQTNGPIYAQPARRQTNPLHYSPARVDASYGPEPVRYYTPQPTHSVQPSQYATPQHAAKYAQPPVQQYHNASQYPQVSAQLLRHAAGKYPQHSVQYAAAQYASHERRSPPGEWERNNRQYGGGGGGSETSRSKSQMNLVPVGTEMIDNRFLNKYSNR